MDGVNDSLQRHLKVILRPERTRLHLYLESIKTGQDVDTGLLIARRWIFEIC